MTDLNVPGEEQLKKQQEFFEKARKGVLKYLSDKGGKLNMGDLHEHSMNKYLIQHQRFSQMMETFVSEGLIDFDWGAQLVTLTEKGKQFLAA